MTGSAAVVDLPYIKAERNRQGVVRYFYFRRHGRRWRLPGEPLSEEWLAEYSRLKADTEPRPAEASITPIPGSLKDVAVSYYRSPEYRNLKPKSQRIYRFAIAPLIDLHGHKPIALVERRHVKAWRDAKIDTPGMANMLVKVVRILLAYAIDSGFRRDNPAVGVKPFKLGEHRAWSVGELAAYEQRWPQGSMQRRAYALARYTGQRCGDVAGMTRAHRRDGRIWVKQQKTDQELWIHEHSELAAELARGEQGHMSLLTKKDGSSFDGESLSRWMAEAIADAELPDDCVMHGLRKVAARDLADAGCSVHEIMSVTGHESLTEIARYTKSANQGHLSEVAIRKLERNGKRTNVDKRSGGGSGKRKLSD
jgi:integrase